MAEPTVPTLSASFNRDDKQTWNEADLHTYLHFGSQGKSLTLSQCQAFFEWTAKELAAACDAANALIKEHGLDGANNRLKKGAATNSIRFKIENDLVNHRYSKLFRDRYQETPKPAWFIDRLIKSDSESSVEYWTVIERFLGLAFTKGKRAVKTEEDDDKVTTKKRDASRLPGRSRSVASSVTGGVKRMRIGSRSGSRMSNASGSGMDIDDEIYDLAHLPPLPPLPELDAVEIHIFDVQLTATSMGLVFHDSALLSDLLSSKGPGFSDHQIRELCDSAEFNGGKRQLYAFDPFNNNEPTKLEGKFKPKTIAQRQRDRLMIRDGVRDRGIKWFLAESLEAAKLVPMHERTTTTNSKSVTYSLGDLEALRQHRDSDEDFVASHSPSPPLRTSPPRSPTPNSDPEHNGAQPSTEGDTIADAAIPPLPAPKKATGPVALPELQKKVYPNMIYPLAGLESLSIKDGPEAPTMSLPYPAVKNASLSSAVSQEKGDKSTTLGYITSQGNFDHMNPENWKAFCDFLGFDETEHHSKVSITFPGLRQVDWTSAKQRKGVKVPFVYQAFSAWWVLRNLVRGAKLALIGHNMGIGKTITCLDLAVKLTNLRQINDGRGSHIEQTDTYFNANTYALGENEPEIRGGPVLIAVGKASLVEWMKEHTAVVGPNRKLVLASSSFTSKSLFEEKNSLYYPHYLPTMLVRAKDRPAGVDFKRIFGKSPEKITVYDLLLPKMKKIVYNKLGFVDVQESEIGSLEPQPWQSDWFVLTAHSVLSNSFGTCPPDEPGSVSVDTKHRIFAAFSYCFVDEHHQLGNYSRQEWKTIGTLLGEPSIILVSATSFGQLKNLLGPFMAIEQRYYNEDIWDYMMKKADELTFIEGLDDETQTQLVENGARAWKTIANKVDKRKKAKGNVTAIADQMDDEEGGDPDAAMHTPEFQTLMKDAATRISEFDIAFATDHWWQPADSTPGMPATEFPPNSHFDVEVPIPEDFKEYLEPKWKAALRTNKTKDFTEGKAVNFLETTRDLRILSLFACLAKLTTEDPQLNAEVDKMRKEEGVKITNLGKDSVLWTYMSAIDQLPSMVTLRSILEGLYSQMNAYNKPRKVVVTGHVPFSVAVIDLYFTWLNAQKNFEPLRRKGSWVYLSAEENTRQEQIDAFKGLSESESTYSDKPTILLSSITYVKSGLSLTPADSVVFIDQDWNIVVVEQGAGRVRRDKVAQKAKFTEIFRLITSASWCPIQTIMVKRQQDASAMAEMIRTIKGDYDIDEDPEVVEV